MHRIHRILCALGCALLPVSGIGAPAEPTKPRVHRFSTQEQSWNVNAYWLESAEGIVLIDTLLLKSDARQLAAAIKQTGKPLAGILITHPHVDHFGGMSVFRAAFPGVPIYATRATSEGMTVVHERALKAGWITRMFGDDYESQLVLPDHPVESGANLELAGMHFTLDDVGAIDAAVNTVILNTELNALFAGDATVFGGVVYVGEGHSAEARAALEAMASRYPSVSRVYSGHYEAMRPKPLFAENLAQFSYLRGVMGAYLGVAGNRAADGQLSEAARQRLVEEVSAHFDGHRNYGYGPAGFAGFNLAGLEREMVAEMKAVEAAGKKQ